ncbi:DM13 domain-containing protein [Patescibacteria group bacterium]|nr:DM13 domain-containing protein [Patescibacteria group bacterium]
MIKKISIGIVGIVVLGILYYTMSPVFRHVRVDEVAPESKKVVESSEVAITEGGAENMPTSIAQEEGAMANTRNAAPVVGTIGHPASGTVRIIKTDSGDVVRYENFKTLNGPDLYVYLAKDLDAKEYISLGELRATEGNVNYEVPSDINTEEYRYAMVWCKQFGVLFNYADLSS